MISKNLATFEKYNKENKLKRVRTIEEILFVIRNFFVFLDKEEAIVLAEDRDIGFIHRKLMSTDDGDFFQGIL